MTTISGILIDGAGQPLPNVQIVLTALKTSSKVIVQSKALIAATSETGSYSINAQPGSYSVTILRKGFPTEKVGRINVYSDSESGTLNDFLINPSESEITPEILAQVVDERKQAQQASKSAQTSATQASSTLTNTVKKTGETTQTVSGTLSAATLQENGKRVYSPNNKPTASDVVALPLSGGTLSGDLTISKSRPFVNLRNSSNEGFSIIAENSGNIAFSAYYDNAYQLKFYYDKNNDRINFQNTPLVNNTAVLKQGDYGVGSSDTVGVISGDISQLFNTGFYVVNNATTGNVPHSASDLIIHRRSSAVQTALAISNSVSQPPKTGVFFNGVWIWQELITTANSTVDSNGFYKKASPICRLFANDNITNVDGFKIAGCGLVNSEADGVIAKRVDVGHYEIHGSLGFAKEGWYITLPEDANGNKKFFAEYSTDQDNVITVKTFTRRFDIEQCAIVAGEPVDIIEDRWIDLRLEMPVVEINDEVASIPSSLNPVIC